MAAAEGGGKAPKDAEVEVEAAVAEAVAASLLAHGGFHDELVVEDDIVHFRSADAFTAEVDEATGGAITCSITWVCAMEGGAW